MGALGIRLTPRACQKIVGNVWAVYAVIFLWQAGIFLTPCFVFLSFLLQSSSSYLFHLYLSLSISLSVIPFVFLFSSILLTFYTLVFFACLALFLNYTHTTRRVCEAGFEGRQRLKRSKAEMAANMASEGFWRLLEGPPSYIVPPPNCKNTRASIWPL